MTNYWETAFDALPDLISLHTKDFKIIKTNKALRDFIGKSDGQIIEPCYRELFGLVTPCAECPLIRTVADEGVHTREDYINGKYVIITTAPIYDDNEFIGIIHSIKDISEQKNAERRITNISNRMKALLEVGQVGIVVFQNDICIYANARSYEIWESTVDTVIGATQEEMYNKQPIELLEGSFQSATSDWSERIFMRVSLSSGIKYIASYGATVKQEGESDVLIVQSADVTERHTMIEALEHSEAKFRSMINRMSDGLAVVSVDLSTYYMVNPQLIKMSGYDAAELMKMPYTELFDLQSLEEIETQREIAQAGATTKYTVTAIRKDGSKLDLIVSGAPFNGGDKRLILFTDVTELKKTKECLSDLRTIKRKWRLGEILLKDNAITFEQLKTALSNQNKKLGEILVSSGSIDDGILNEALKKQRLMNFKQ